MVTIKAKSGRWQNGEYVITMPNGMSFRAMVFNETAFPPGQHCNELVKFGCRVQLRSEYMFWQRVIFVTILAASSTLILLFIGAITNRFSLWYLAPLAVPIIMTLVRMRKL